MEQGLLQAAVQGMAPLTVGCGTIHSSNQGRCGLEPINAQPVFSEEQHDDARLVGGLGPWRARQAPRPSDAAAVSRAVDRARRTSEQYPSRPLGPLSRIRVASSFWITTGCHTQPTSPWREEGLVSAPCVEMAAKKLACGPLRSLSLSPAHR